MSFLKILYVEDMPIVQMDISATLQNAGFDVIEAADVPSALAAYEHSKDDIGLLLTDLRLPGGSGVDIIAHMRKDRPDLPVIVVSGSPDIWLDAQRTQPDLTESVTFLGKPLLLPSLIDEVRKKMPQAVRHDPVALEGAKASPVGVR